MCQGPVVFMRLHHVADGAVEVHAVAAEAIVHQVLLRVLHGIGEDLLVGGAVRAGVPGCVLLLVAVLAVGYHRDNIHVAQADGLRQRAEEMDADVAQLGGQAGLVALHAVGGAVRRSRAPR